VSAFISNARFAISLLSRNIPSCCCGTRELFCCARLNYALVFNSHFHKFAFSLAEICLRERILSCFYLLSLSRQDLFLSFKFSQAGDSVSHIIKIIYTHLCVRVGEKQTKKLFKGENGTAYFSRLPRSLLPVYLFRLRAGDTQAGAEFLHFLPLDSQRDGDLHLLARTLLSIDAPLTSEKIRLCF
jgi:hypothetical protein